MLITNLKQQTHERVKALIYGESGAGKTTLLGTLKGKTLVISSERGTRPLEGKDIDCIDISVHNTLKDDLGNPLTLTNPEDRIKKLRAAFKFLHDGKSGYQNVCIDSLTEIADIYIEDLNAKFPDRKDSFPMWGEYAKRMKATVRNFRDLPCNVFITALSKADKNEVGKRYMAFDIAGSISDKLPQYFDQVLYLHSDAEGNRSIITQKTETNLCKDRSGKLEPKEPADLGLIMGKIVLKNAGAKTITAEKKEESKK